MRQNNSCFGAFLKKRYIESSGTGIRFGKGMVFKVEDRYFVSSGEMKEYDKSTMEYYGIPSMVLMERAALAVAEEIESRTKRGQRVLIVSGCGNNGGDGIAAGRILMQRGYKVDFVLIGERETCSEETKRQISIIEKYGCLLQGKIRDGEYDIIVDALFGIGLSRAVEGIYAETIGKMNRSKGMVCSVDIPSGISADTGRVMNGAVKADLTVTFAFEKLGHIFYPGCNYAGELICRDIGITEESFRGKRPFVHSYAAGCRKEIKKLMPVRAGDGNKGTFGKALVIAGSRNMSGACELCAGSCYRIGAGMVKIVTAEANREIVQRAIPEALLTTYREADGMLPESFYKDMEWADGIIIGPGTGTGETARLMLEKVILESEKPLLIDADGLNILAQSEALQNYMADRKGSRQIILTPHAAEFARVAGCTVREVKENPLIKVRELAERLGCVVVCKDARTVVAAFKEEGIFLNTTGNDALATAGSGDVLAGMIGGLSVQGMPAAEAACKGVYIHGILGEMAAAATGSYAVMAGDLKEQLKYILADEGIGK